MSNNEKKYTDAEATNNAEELASNNTESTPLEETPTTPEQQIAMLTEALDKEKKEYLFLMAEFDNFRKRTIKEKSEIIKNAKGQVLEEILPIVDDFERGLKAASDTENAQAIKEGMDLIYNKFISYLERNGIKAIESDGVEFNEDFHEAITTIPAPNESMKKKVIDTIQKGYMINDKVLRYAKVVVGQ
ncbi:MAG: nucleotide exchange factor GrpE [Bacteroidales bacterium]|nr:nucleotide exchange factor GrpE [Bacteroidales bacterium]